jgi:hypothetical protein
MAIYELNKTKKGIAYIINNLHIEQSQTQNDVTNLENMFKRINVKVESVKENQVSNSSAFLHTNFSYEHCFSSFYYVHATRKSCDVHTKNSYVKR